MGGIVIHKTITLFSKRLELYYLLIRYFGSEYEVDRFGYRQEREEILTILDKGPELLIIEVECSFIEALNLARRFRLCAYTGFILLISTTKERDKQIEEKICAIDSGVDEYLGHRQTNEEIIASVKALLRRFQWKADLELRISGRNFLVNPQSRKISLDNKECIFTRTEFAILNYLIWNLNRAVSYKELYEAVWEKEYLHDDMNIMAHIHRIRKKMGDDTKNPLYIQNVYGTGYMIEGE